MKKIQIICPTGGVTGGPEALHQLGDILAKKGVECWIVYHPYEMQTSITKEYKEKYSVNVKSSPIDDSGILTIVPEVFTSVLEEFKLSCKSIWWLSIDNYFGSKGKLSKYFYQKFDLGKRDSFPDVAFHLCQSEYSREFITGKVNGKILMLSDYIDKEYTRPVDKRDNVVLFNPMKESSKVVNLLKNNSVKILPLKGMGRKQLVEVMRRSKVYIDFGNHPGKDRFPREAASQGCIVFVGKKGAAKNLVDIPIPDYMKLDEQRVDFSAEFIDRLLNFFDQYDEYYFQLAEYRKYISRDEQVFSSEVDKLIDIL